MFAHSLCPKKYVVAGSRVYHQRRHSGFPGDTWPDQPCVPAFPIFVNGDRLSQVPACRISNQLSNQIWNLPVRFSQSESLLTSSDGTVESSKDVERILLHCFSRLVIHDFLSVFLWIVLCTRDAFHNKIRNDVSEQVCACMSIDHRSPCPVLYSSGTKVTTVVPCRLLGSTGLNLPRLLCRMSDRSCRILETV